MADIEITTGSSTMTDDLIERLHSCEYVAYYDGEPGIVADEKLLHEAADRIETQANTIEELRAANERWVIAFKLAEERANGRIEALLADKAKLREALHFYADWHPQPSDGPWGANSRDFGGVARKALESKP